jgi:hypothetical protein
MAVVTAQRPALNCGVGIGLRAPHAAEVAATRRSPPETERLLPTQSLEKIWGEHGTPNEAREKRVAMVYAEAGSPDRKQTFLVSLRYCAFESHILSIGLDQRSRCSS